MNFNMSLNVSVNDCLFAMMDLSITLCSRTMQIEQNKIVCPRW